MKNNYMKYIKYSFFIGLLYISLVSSSCTPNIIDEFEPIDEKWSSIDDFTSSLNSTKKVSIPNAEAEFVIKTELATYHFQESSITDQNGTIVEGPIDLIYKEMNSSGDLIESGIDSEGTAGETLMQYFAAHLTFKKGNQFLKIDNLNPISVYLESDNNTLDSQNTFIWLDDGINHGWFPTTSSSLESKYWDFDINGQNYQGSGFKMKIYETGWNSMADFEFQVFENDYDYSTLNISLDTKYHNSKTKVYAVHKDRMSIIPIRNVSGQYLHNQILKGEEVRLIVLSVIDEKLHFGRKDIIVGATNDYNINANEVSYVELLEELKRL